MATGLPHPQWNNGDVHDGGRANLFVYCHGQRYATTNHHVSGKSDARDGSWSVFGSSELSGCNTIG